MKAQARKLIDNRHRNIGKRINAQFHQALDAKLYLTKRLAARKGNVKGENGEWARGGQVALLISLGRCFQDALALSLLLLKLLLQLALPWGGQPLDGQRSKPRRWGDELLAVRFQSPPRSAWSRQVWLLLCRRHELTLRPQSPEGALGAGLDCLWAARTRGDWAFGELASDSGGGTLQAVAEGAILRACHTHAYIAALPRLTAAGTHLRQELLKVGDHPCSLVSASAVCTIYNRGNA